jgi:uncharacterized membrane protein YeiH
VVWAGICHDVHIQLQIVQGTLNAVKYRYDLLGLIVLPFREASNNGVCEPRLVSRSYAII